MIELQRTASQETGERGRLLADPAVFKQGEKHRSYIYIARRVEHMDKLSCTHDCADYTAAICLCTVLYCIMLEEALYFEVHDRSPVTITIRRSLDGSRRTVCRCSSFSPPLR